MKDGVGQIELEGGREDLEDLRLLADQIEAISGRMSLRIGQNKREEG